MLNNQFLFKNRCVASAHHVNSSPDTAEKTVNTVAEVFASRVADFVSLPDDDEKEASSRFYYEASGIPGCIGGIKSL